MIELSQEGDDTYTLKAYAAGESPTGRGFTYIVPLNRNTRFAGLDQPNANRPLTITFGDQKGVPGDTITLTLQQIQQGDKAVATLHVAH